MQLRRKVVCVSHDLFLGLERSAQILISTWFFSHDCRNYVALIYSFIQGNIWNKIPYKKIFIETPRKLSLRSNNISITKALYIMFYNIYIFFLQLEKYNEKNKMQIWKFFRIFSPKWHYPFCPLSQHRHIFNNFCKNHIPSNHFRIRDFKKANENKVSDAHKIRPL